MRRSDRPPSKSSTGSPAAREQPPARCRTPLVLSPADAAHPGPCGSGTAANAAIRSGPAHWLAEVSTALEPRAASAVIGEDRQADTATTPDDQVGVGTVMIATRCRVRTSLTPSPACHTADTPRHLTIPEPWDQQCLRTSAEKPELHHKVSGYWLGTPFLVVTRCHRSTVRARGPSSWDAEPLRAGDLGRVVLIVGFCVFLLCRKGLDVPPVTPKEATTHGNRSLLGKAHFARCPHQGVRFATNG